MHILVLDPELDRTRGNTHVPHCRQRSVMGWSLMWLRLTGVGTAILLADLLTVAADAKPTDGLRAMPRPAPSVSSTAARHCRWHNGQRLCPPFRGTGPGYGFMGSDYYEHDANKLPFGTERWRDQMRRENRLGNPG
jgi:hypothetical protein